MKYPNILALPSSILLLCVCSHAAELQWPHNVPKHLKYFPEDEHHIKRGLDLQERLKKEKPIGVKKMSVDEGEMFFLDNWIFASDVQDVQRRSEPADLTNLTDQLVSPLRLHMEETFVEPSRHFRGRSASLKRDFKCPQGTNDCSSIGAPNSCCNVGDTCISIEDTGLGSVGCCSSGQSCRGKISCDDAKGYTGCKGSPNGGCCMPGYTCQDVGCVLAGTSTTFVEPPSSTSSSSTSSTGVVVVPTTTSPTPTAATSATCTSGWFSCPASLGGGCCQTGRQCATGVSCPGPDDSSSTSEIPSAPVRPTGDTASVAATTTSDDLCPTGFYACSAYYPSGCCRVGRNCETSGSCISTPTETIVNSNGVTIVAPTGASVATTAAPQPGSCPSAWYSCPANRGGNCCPEGYSCAEQCSATAGTSVVAKVAPTSSNAPTLPNIEIRALFTAVVTVGIATLLL